MHANLDTYRSLLSQRLKECDASGFEGQPHDYLFDFQKYLVDWSLQMGRSATLSDCGTGKTPMQLSWAENVVRHTGKRVIILTPLAVAQQTVHEARKFGIEAEQSRGKPTKAAITVANYEMLSKFDPKCFGGIVCDESSILKNFKSATKKHVLDFSRKIQYRSLYTATAAPNDYFELGNSSEVLGYLGFRDMITTFFRQETMKDRLGWGRTKFRFRGHAERPFWRWVCSWARSVRKPSDIGFSDKGYALPPLNVREIVVKDSTPRDGMLFAMPARNMQEEREERRNTIVERCELLASRANDLNEPVVVWCHLNDEGDLLEKLIPDGVQVSGSQSDEQKEEYLHGFADGSIRVLITKPKIACFGLNWQHCSNVFMFPSHSFEQYYQAVRRCWRFGQTKPVEVEVIATEGERGVVKNLQRKADQADAMFSLIVEHMRNELKISSDHEFPFAEQVPQWL